LAFISEFEKSNTGKNLVSTGKKKKKAPKKKFDGEFGALLIGIMSLKASAKKKFGSSAILLRAPMGCIVMSAEIGRRDETSCNLWRINLCNSNEGGKGV